MKKVNVTAIPEQEKKSPRGKYQRYVKEISVALGRERDSLDLASRHPFDVAIVRIPAGKSYCPYHLHSAETEFYVVVSGRGMVRDSGGNTEVKAGDAFLFAPGEAHQLTATDDEELVYYVVADNPRGDACHYPDSGKWAVPVASGETIVRGTEADYYSGEE